MDKNVIDILEDIIGIAIGLGSAIYYKSLGEKTAQIQQRGYGKWFYVNLLTDRSIKFYQLSYLVGGIVFLIINLFLLIRRLLTLF